MSTPDLSVAGGQRLVIAGGGVAAVEALLAARALAPEGGPEILLIAADPSLRLPPHAALKPFARGHADPLPLAEVLADHDGHFVHARIATVDPRRHVVVLDDGREVAYDELLVAVGGVPVKGTDRGTGFELASPEVVAGVAADLELGWARSAAVVVPDGPTWPLPAYEIALQLAEHAAPAGGAVHLFIPDEEPLSLFGARASGEVRALLADAGVKLYTDERLRVVRTGLVERDHLRPPVKVDRILSMPRIVGPAIPGLPLNDAGFIEVDAHGRVAGLTQVHAAGDGTSLPYKFGGLACQQADAAVADILADLGHPVERAPLDPVFDARLVAGDRELVLHHDPSGADRRAPDWSGGAKIAGRYLTDYVAVKGIAHLAHRGQ
ncbi:MAG: FAD-dependent oxidoreductase [Solirubrobacteraceae bacterium]|nr:FAD-dependent oxidoreductase [Solirubrobacteraceae bacterium]